MSKDWTSIFDQFYNIEKLKMNDILISISDSYIFLYYKVKNEKLSRFMFQISNKKEIDIITKFDKCHNPIRLKKEEYYLKFNNKEYIKFLSSNDITIVKMGITIIINEFLESINKYYENK